jgi:chromosome segregation ATPase
MDKFDDILEFIAGYSEDQPQMDLQAFEQLKETMTNYLELEGVLSDAENICTRIFKSCQLSFMKAGIIVLNERNLANDLDHLEQFVEHVDKTMNLSESKSKEFEQKRVQLGLLEQETAELRAKLESVTHRCTSSESELSVTFQELRDANDRINSLEIELNSLKVSSKETIDHFEGLYRDAIKKTEQSSHYRSMQNNALEQHRDALEKELTGVKEELETIIKSSSGVSHKLTLTDHELTNIKAEYQILKDKYLRITGDHQDEMRGYQLEIEDLNHKLIEAKSSKMVRQDSIDLTAEDNNGLDQDFIAEALGVIADQLDDFSQGSTGSRTYNARADKPFMRKDRRYSKQENSITAGQHSTMEQSHIASSGEVKSAVDSSMINHLKSNIENLKKEIVEKDLELEELRLRMNNSNEKLTVVMNEFTDEILRRDKTIISLKSQLRKISLEVNPPNTSQVAPVQQPTNEVGIMDSLLSKYFK